MSRPIPYADNFHKRTNTARCWVGGKWVSLGRYGSPESRQAHARIVAEHAGQAAPPCASVAPASGAGLNVVEVLIAFFRHATQHYRGADGKPTGELANFAAAVRPLREMFDLSPAASFGPRALKAVRERMIGAGICRDQINKRVKRIQHVFKWAESEELVPASVYHGLQTVAGLQAGRSLAVESPPVEPAADADVDATTPFLNRHVRGLVLFQRFTGCRPGEACAVRRCDLDTSGAVWLYKPPHHKTRHRGRAEPEGRPEAPARGTVQRGRLRLRDSQGHRAGERSRQPQPRLRAGAGTGAAVGANRIRHTFATMVRKGHGLEAAQVLLGHARADTTQIYGERDESLAVSVAGKIG